MPRRRWRGLRYLTAKGYWVVTVSPGKHRPEHILIAERVLGRALRPAEAVHHINLDKTDNRNSNLLICTRDYHAWLHHEMARQWALEHLSSG